MDTPHASFLVVTIPTLYPGDDYTFPDTPPFIFGKESNSSSRVVTYSGVEPLGAYVNLTHSFTYRNSLDEPGMSTRGLTIQIFTPSDTLGEILGSNIPSTLIRVLPVNDNPPEFSQAVYEGSIMENAQPRTLVGVTVMAQDRDNSEGTNITYASSDGFFSVHPLTGVVSSIAPLDAELLPVYELTVTASDNDEGVSLTSSALVLINITDINDVTPVFNQSIYSVSTREDAPVGFTLLTVSATDGDVSEANSGVAYAIDASTDGSGSGVALMGAAASLPFAVDSLTGVITVTESLDFDRGVTLYQFTVLATDTGFPPVSSTSQVRVRVTDVNDNPPEFTNSLFSFTVEEDTLVPSAVVSFAASDIDSGAGGQVQFSLEGTNTFSINPTTGLLSLTRSLDFETNRSHVFFVVASDLGSPQLSSQEMVVITVGNVNDNQPVFSQPSYTFMVPENTGFSETVEATDADRDTIRYRAVSGFVPGIEVDIFSGEIFSIPGFFFDFESQNSYLFVVEAIDSSFSVTANVTIMVSDVNDQPPVFPQDVYEVDIDESLSPGSSVIQVNAEDGDVMENAIVEYSLVPRGTFSINQLTGVISVSGPLDFDAGPTQYSLNVTARNPTSPFFEDYATVSIFLQDINDIPPELALDELNVTFVENEEPGAIMLAPDLVISDGDGIDHPLVRCTVVLVKSCIASDTTTCEESISVNGQLAEQMDVRVQSLGQGSEQILVVSGNVSELIYQSLLQTLQYDNPAPEPIPGQRTVTIQCQDEDFSSNAVEIAVFVQLRNEFCPVVTVASQEFNFTEGSYDLPVGLLAEFVLSDEDARPHNSLRGLRITLSNRLDSTFESISINDTAGLRVNMSDPPVGAVIGSGNDIFPTTQTIMLLSPGMPRPIFVFQRALRSLLYTNTNPEPSVGPRTITISPMDRMVNCSSVNLTVHILPVNDNPPDLVLSLGNTLQYLEESGPLAFADETGLTVSDPDHNNLFPLQGASAVLSGILNTGEALQYADSALPAGVEATSSQDGMQSIIQPPIIESVNLQQHTP
jgi:hypothetical protein